MYQDIATIIDYYSENKALLGKRALEMIVDIIIKHDESIKPYINGINLTEQKREDLNFNYNMETGVINFCLDYCYDLLEKKYGDGNFSLKNEYMVQVLLHVIRYAKEYELTLNSKNNLEALIIEACIIIRTNMYNYFLSNFKCCPLERIAEIDSLFQMLKITSEININNKEFYTNKIAYLLHRDYSKIFRKSPTEKFISNSGAFADFYLYKEKLNELTKELSLEERLRLGLRVSKDEFNNPLDYNILIRKL